jgi:hypothetical protein
MLHNFAKRRRLVVLLAVLSVVALVLVGRWLNATKGSSRSPQPAPRGAWRAAPHRAGLQARSGRIVEKRSARSQGLPTTHAGRFRRRFTATICHQAPDLRRPRLFSS